jgi:hypothetical protein
MSELGPWHRTLSAYLRGQAQERADQWAAGSGARVAWVLDGADL